MSGALPEVEHGTRSTAACGGRNAAHSAIASSAPSTSPDGEETATSASSSRSARDAISAAPSATNGSMLPSARDLVAGQRLRRAPLAHGSGGQPAQRVVDRRRHAVQPAEQRRSRRSGSRSRLRRRRGRGSAGSTSRRARGRRSASRRAAPSRFATSLTSSATNSIPAARQRGLALCLRELDELVGSGPGSQSASTALPRLPEQLGVLEAHDVRPRPRAEVRGAQRDRRPPRTARPTPLG